MKPEFTEYFTAVGMPNTVQNRIEAIYEYYVDICPEQLDDVFVTDLVKEDQTRSFQSLWFFSASLMMEAKDFVSKDDFDMTGMRNKVTYWSIEKQSYDFMRAVESSRLSLKFSLSTGVVGNLKATGKNCDYLRGIILKYVKANMVM